MDQKLESKYVERAKSCNFKVRISKLSRNCFKAHLTPINIESHLRLRLERRQSRCILRPSESGAQDEVPGRQGEGARGGGEEPEEGQSHLDATFDREAQNSFNEVA